MNLQNLIIKKVETSQELLDIQHLHRTIWGLVDLEVTPGHILLAAQKANGLVLCAYYEGQSIGFSFGFCGVTDDHQVYLYSHNIGILEEFRNCGVGYQIKLKQREYMLARGIDLVAWTSDPLESRNANFNFGRLGCVCERYFRDYYGPMPDQLNENVPSDRLIVEWHLNSKRVIDCLMSPKKRQHPSQAPRVRVLNQTKIDESGLLRPVDSETEIDQLVREGINQVYIEIPSNYQELRQRDLSLVLEWRFTVRHLLETCLSQEMFISGFIYAEGRSLYVLDRAAR